MYIFCVEESIQFSEYSTLSFFELHVPVHVRYLAARQIVRLDIGIDNCHMRASHE